MVPALHCSSVDVAAVVDFPEMRQRVAQRHQSFEIRCLGVIQDTPRFAAIEGLPEQNAARQILAR
jgi:hypothetical protein